MSARRDVEREIRLHHLARALVTPERFDPERFDLRRLPPPPPMFAVHRVSSTTFRYSWRVRALIHLEHLRAALRYPIVRSDGDPLGYVRLANDWPRRGLWADLRGAMEDVARRIEHELIHGTGGGEL